VPEQNSVGSSPLEDLVAFSHFTHWFTSPAEATEASSALRLVKTPEPANVKERVRTVTEPNFIVASEMRNYAPSDLTT
jgi:hypothetical protein